MSNAAKYVPSSNQYEACDVGKEKKRSPRSRSLVLPDNKSSTKAFVYTNETCLFDNFNSILKVLYTDRRWSPIHLDLCSTLTLIILITIFVLSTVLTSLVRCINKSVRLMVHISTTLKTEGTAILS